jgi:5-methylcytosine-specific restriction endonuclease McrA
MRKGRTTGLNFENIAGKKRVVSALCSSCQMVKPISEFEILHPGNLRVSYMGIAYHCNGCKQEKEARHRKQERSTLIEKLGGKCCLCGATTNLQMHHIIPRKKYGYLMSRPEFIPESLKEVVCLCYDCHLHKAHEKGYAGHAVCGNFPADAPRLIMNE